MASASTTLWHEDSFAGAELNLDVQYARNAVACRLKSAQLTTMDQLTETMCC